MTMNGIYDSDTVPDVQTFPLFEDCLYIPPKVDEDGVYVPSRLYVEQPAQLFVEQTCKQCDDYVLTKATKITNKEKYGVFNILAFSFVCCDCGSAWTQEITFG